MNPVRISKHAAERFCQRADLLNMRKLLREAQEKGLPFAETTGPLRDYCDRMVAHKGKGQASVIYEGLVWFIHGNTVISVWPVPRDLRISVLSQTIRRQRGLGKGESGSD